MVTLSLKNWITKIAQMFIVYTYDYTKFTYSSGFTYYSTAGEHSPKACKFGRIVNLSGTIKVTTARTSTAGVTIGRVPSGCEPLYEMHCHNNFGANHCRVVVRPNGEISADLFPANPAVNSWISIDCTYISKAATSNEVASGQASSSQRQPIKIVQYGWQISGTASARSRLAAGLAPSNSANPGDQPSGYSFVAWIEWTTHGWVGTPYAETPTSETTALWSYSDKPATSDVSVYGLALYIRSDLI